MSPVHAQEEPRGHTVNFQINEQINAENDMLKLSLQSVQEAGNSQEVIQQINAQMSKALQALEALGLNKTQLKMNSGNYQIHPIYNKQNQISHWRGQQSLEIQVHDLALVSKVLAAAQQHLIYQSMQFALSDERRKTLSQQLLVNALKRYQEQAERIAQQLGASRYELLQTNINSARALPVTRMAYAAPAAMEMVDAAVVSGSSDVQISVQGTLFIPW
ncbi:SIMPL domain-containing protein [Thiosulfatimonas sediminis]|uniref:SIMPL domain-containing protein n=1 Tax=Thiosulfatimonas sediminis TaxID=2675054 RepID=UPI001564A84F|nr:SIMPL domain-containing protein [Thiosulfatimonas sediminis]